jgi:hypothetical protein
MKSFEKYVKLNKQLEFNVIVGFLNNAERLTSIKERFFINIIAFERLCSRYADYIGASESFVPNEDDFKPIKEDLLHIIQKHEKDFGNYLNRARSIVGGLNRIKPHSTGDKMYRLIQDVGIPIDVDIERLVNEVRHTSVHKGEIGSKEEAYINYNLLDELIREIILRLVGYDGPRASKVLFVETVN